MVLGCAPIVEKSHQKRRKEEISDRLKYVVCMTQWMVTCLLGDVLDNVTTSGGETGMDRKNQIGGLLLLRLSVPLSCVVYR